MYFLSVGQDFVVLGKSTKDICDMGNDKKNLLLKLEKYCFSETKKISDIQHTDLKARNTRTVILNGNEFEATEFAEFCNGFRGAEDCKITVCLVFENPKQDSYIEHNPNYWANYFNGYGYKITLEDGLKLEDAIVAANRYSDLFEMTKKIEGYKKVEVSFLLR